MKNEQTVTLVHRLVPDTSQRVPIFNEIVKKEQNGWSFHEAPASLELLIARLLNGKKMPFEIKEYHVSLRGSGALHVCEAIVKVLVGHALLHKVSEGNGPISALDGALRLALEDSFPHLRDVRLENYSVELVGPHIGADSRTRVLVVTADKERRFTTMGVSQNVIEASLQALADGMEYALLPRKK